MDDDAGDRSQPRADRAVRFDGDLTRPPGDVPVGTVVSTTVPPRLDRLPWSSWHRRVIVALGITWTLDGLEATLISAAGPVLTEPDTLGLTEGQLGIANGCYLAGEVAGALVFGHLTDRYGRKRLFLVTIVLYLVATALTGASPNLAVFAVCRALRRCRHRRRVRRHQLGHRRAGPGTGPGPCRSGDQRQLLARRRDGRSPHGGSAERGADPARDRLAPRASALGALLGVAISGCAATCRRARAGS